MIVKYLFLIVFSTTFLRVCSQEIVRNTINTGVGNCGIALLNPETITANPANIAFVNYHKTIYLQHSYSYFVRYLPSTVLNVIAPFGLKYPFHIQLVNEGSAYYRHQQMQLAYGLKLDPNFSLGLEVGMLNVYMVEYGNYSGLNAKIGTHYKHNDQLSFAFTVTFPVGNHSLLNITRKPQLVCGFAKEIETVICTAELYTNPLTDKLHTRVGFVYPYSRQIRFRTGYDVGYNSFGAGITLHTKQHLLIDFSVQYHGKLGYTPSMAIGYVEYVNDL